LCYVHLFLFAATTTVDFRRNSFIEWDFQDHFYAGLDKHGAHRMNFQLMFRTRQQSTGLLWKAQNAQKSEYLVLEVGPFTEFVRCSQLMNCNQLVNSIISELFEICLILLCYLITMLSSYLWPTQPFSHWG